MKQMFLISGISVLMFISLCYCNKHDKHEYKNVILKEYTGYDSGVKEEEHYLFLTQDEIDSFIIKKENELKHSLPITTTPKISPNEICLFIFMGEHNRGILYVNAMEEQNKIVFRFRVRYGQTFDIMDSKGNITEHYGPEFGGSVETPFGYFILPKTNKKIVIERNMSIFKGKEDWQTVKEFNPR